MAMRPNPTAIKGDMYYGPMKALSERAAEQMMPGRVLTIRPG